MIHTSPQSDLRTVDLDEAVDVTDTRIFSQNEDGEMVETSLSLTKSAVKDNLHSGAMAVENITRSTPMGDGHPHDDVFAALGEAYPEAKPKIEATPIVEKKEEPAEPSVPMTSAAPAAKAKKWQWLKRVASFGFLS